VSRIRSAYSKIREAEDAAHTAAQKAVHDKVTSDVVFRELARETLAAAAKRLVTEANGKRTIARGSHRTRRLFCDIPNAH
jgi:hypothetical protein